MSFSYSTIEIFGLMLLGPLVRLYLRKNTNKHNYRPMKLSLNTKEIIGNNSYYVKGNLLFLQHHFGRESIDYVNVKDDKGSEVFS